MCKIAKAWVQVEIEVDEDWIGNQKDSRLVAECVEDGVARVTQVYHGAMSDLPGAPTYSCGSCGAGLDSLSEDCWKCVPEQEEWREDDLRQRGREAAVAL